MHSALSIKEQLASLVRESLSRAVSAGTISLDPADYEGISIEVPREKQHGDFATNAALALARKARRAPRQIAEVIVSNLLESDELVQQVEIAGPGFINFRLRPAVWIEVANAVLEHKDSYGNGPKRGERVQVEFVSANPTGPMNVVNARAAAVGDCIARLLQASGYEVEKEFYINDGGRQAELFAASLEARFQQLLGHDADIPEDGYPGDYVLELAEKLRAAHPELEGMGEEERLAFFRRAGIDAMVDWQRRDLANFGVNFDVWFHERDLHERGEVDEAVHLLEERGYTYEKDGAIWFASTRFGDDKDRVIVRSDGTYTYLAADAAYHLNKFRRGFDRVIDVWGPDHHGYVARTKAAVAALGYPKDALEILILQLVTLYRSGEQVRMSKRKGEFVAMADLVDEVGRDAARYFFLMRSPDSHLDFDLDLALQQSNENPVYYVQYAHARICSIFREARQAGIDVPGRIDSQQELLTTEAETDLLKKMAEFPAELHTAAARREPHRLAHYVHELAGLFHVFYTQCHVLGSEGEVRAARLALLAAVRTVIARCLDLMGISAPEEM